MPISEPEGDGPAREQALRRGRALVEIVRAGNDGVPLRNRKYLADRIHKQFGDTPTDASLASDINWLKKENWVKTAGNSIKLRKRDYRILADSWCIKALYIAVELCDENRSFLVGAWKDRCVRMITEQKKEISSERAMEKCTEYLVEFRDCGYVDDDVSLEMPSAQFTVKQWSGDWFYLEVARDAHLHRPFRVRPRAPRR